MQDAIDRHLKEAGYQYSLLTSRYFMQPRNFYWEKPDYWRKRGKENTPTKAIAYLMTKLINFGNKGNCDLINTLWWQFTLYFGLQGRQEHRDMKMEITLLRKTMVPCEAQITKMFETNIAICPTKIFQFFITKPPVN